MGKNDSGIPRSRPLRKGEVRRSRVALHRDAPLEHSLFEGTLQIPRLAGAPQAQQPSEGCQSLPEASLSQPAGAPGPVARM